MTVLLPDLRLPELAYWDRDPESEAAYWRAPHVAYLDIEADSLAEGSDAEVDHDWVDPRSRRRRLAFFFQGRRLRVDGGLEEPLQADQLRCAGSGPENKREERSLWWLPRMSEIAPDFEWYAGNAARSERGELADLAGHVLLREGRLEVHDFNRNRDHGIQTWPFGPVARDADGDLLLPEASGAVWNRAIANRIAWDVAIRDAARLVFVDAAGEERTVVIRPPRGAGRAPIEVKIANVEPEVGLLGSEPFFGALRERLPDPDFQAFYRCAGGGSRPATHERWSVPLAPGNLHGIHEKPCAPALYSGFSEDDDA